jgi:hypothetical protein
MVRLLLKVFQVLITLTPREIAVLVIFATTVSAWIAGIQMRRKIKRDLGRKATDADLASIDTWMKVDEVEQRNGRTKPPNIG